MKTKPCTKCQQAKPLQDFPKEPRMRDGRKNQCKACCYAARRVYFTAEKVAAYNKAYFATEVGKAARSKGNKKWRQGAKGKAYQDRPDVREYRNAKMRKYRARNPVKNAARQAVREAKRRGLIPNAKELSCRFCGKPASEYHHLYGYEPEHHLDIIPLCDTCHDVAC